MTDDFILMLEDGSGATLTTTAVFMEKMMAKRTKNVGDDGERGELLMDVENDDVARRDAWFPGSQSADTKCSSAEFDESDESGGEQNVGLRFDKKRRLSIGGRANNRPLFTESIDSELDDRRLRRQIANCNERRRMQSINAGFQALRQLLPRKDGDKMSKAAILAATAEFIHSLLKEKDKLMEENCAAITKKRRLDTEDSPKTILREEGVGPNVIDCLRTIGNLRNSLQKETQLRMAFEKEMAELRCQLHLSTPSLTVGVLPSFPSPRSTADFSSNSSSSPSSNAAGAFLTPPSDMANKREDLLIELVRQREEQQQLFRPTPVHPSDVQLLTSVITTLASVPPNGLALQQQPDDGTVFMSTNESPIGRKAEAPQPMALMGNHQAATTFGTTRPLFVVQQQTVGSADEFNPAERMGAESSAATISQQNLQALVLAIQHLEGSTIASSPVRNGHPSVVTSPIDSDLVVQ
uniref:BHLH domain-containing protein n=1 Tax=Globodera pallida TaxID=36090 RepID=A0A183C970_GLOPA